MTKSDAEFSNADERTHDSPSEDCSKGQPVDRSDIGVSTQKWSRKTIVGRSALILLVIVLLNEWHARHFYGKSLEAIREAVAAHREVDQENDQGLPLTAVEPLISGVPRRADRFHLSKPAHLVTYFSLFRTYAIRLELTDDHHVDSLQTGAWEKGRYTVEPITVREHLVARGHVMPRHFGFSRDKGAVVQLDFVNTPRRGHSHWGYTPNLYRELFRQALLIAAREELQLRTRDVNFGENLLKIERPHQDTEPLQLLVENRPADGGFTLYFGRGPADSIEELEEFSVELPKDVPVEEIVTTAERLSRTTFVDWLKKIDFDGSPNRMSESGAIPDQAKRSGTILNAVSQLATLRLLHLSIRENGESPEQLMALSGAYAILGELTEHFLHPLPEAARARALLYAERLAQRSPDSTLALAGRARVRTLVGLHSAALADLDRMQNLPTSTDDDGGNRNLVADWLSTVEAGARGDLAQLQKQTATEGVGLTAPLAALLQLQHASACGESRLIAAAANRMLALVPAQALGFERLITNATRETEWGRLNEIIVSSSQTIAEHSRQLAGLPESVRSVLAEVPDSTEACADSRTALYEELDTLDEQIADGIIVDAVEPALCTLATVCRESGFLQAVRSVSNRHYPVGYTTEERVELYRPFVKGHQLEAWLVGFSPSRDEAWTTLTTSFSERDRHWYWNRNFAPMMKMWTAWGLMHSGVDRRRQAIYQSSASVFGDLAWQACHGSTGEKRRMAARRLVNVSPNSEAAAAAVVSADWETVEDQASGWEEQFTHSAFIQRRLGEACLDSMSYRAAERCLKRSLSLFPDRTVSKLLAKCYLESGNNERWLDQMQRAAEMGTSETLTDRLISERVSSEIAEELLLQGKVSEALHHAKRATRSASAWGFSIAARCYESAADFKTAEKFIRMEAQNYELPFKWFYWCHRTGHGDLQAARAFIPDDVLQDCHTNPHSEGVVNSMLYHRLAGDLEAAADRLTLGHFAGDVEGPWSALHLDLIAREFLMAHEYRKPLRTAYELHSNLTPEENPLHREISPEEIKNSKHRLSYALMKHRHFTGTGRAVDPWEFFVALRRHFVSEEKQPLNLERLDWIVRAYGSPGSRTNMLYWIGKVLLLDDRKAEAIPYLQMAATSSYSHKYNAVLAGYELGQLGIFAGRLRPTEMEFEQAEEFRLYDEAAEFGRNGELDRAIKRCRKIIERSPDWAPAYYYLGELQQFLGNDEVALEQYGEAMRLKPEISDLRMARGNVFQKLGQFEDAVAEYEKVLELNPRDDDAHWRLGLLRAAAPVDELRDGDAALRHASSIDRDCLHPNNDFDTLFAVAHAERGDFETALQFFEKSNRFSLGDYEVYQRAMADCKAGKPFRLSTPDNKQAGRD